MKVTGSSIEQLEKGKSRARCRKWRLWATTEEGRKSERFTGTWSETNARLEAFVRELEDKVPDTGSFGAYAESWRLWRAKSGGFSPNTLAADRTAVNALRRTKLDKMPLGEIGPADCKEALAWLKEHPLKVAEYKQTSLQTVHSKLGLITEQAEADGLVSRDPMAKVGRPKGSPGERDALSPEELGLFLNRVDEMQLDGKSMALYLMACLGLRCGEALSLKDAEVSGGYASVNTTLRAADNTEGDTKTSAGKRVLPVPPRLGAKVAEWRALREVLGVGDSPWLCCNSKGGMMRYSTMQDWWAAKRDGVGCQGMTLHQLRHSNLSMMARHMSVFDLKAYAGWSSIAPARVYVHDDIGSVARAVASAWS